MMWQTSNLGQVTDRIRNGLNIIQFLDAGGLPITRIETISNQVIDPNRVGFAGIKNGEKLDWYLKPGEIIFSHINSEERIGNCALYSGEPYPLVHGMNLLSLKPNEKKILPKFLLYTIRSPQFRLSLRPITKRAVNQASVSIGNLKDIEILLPPLPEQRCIVEILDQADALRKKRAKADAKAARILPALFYRMFGDPLNNQMDLPTKTIGDLLMLLRNGTTADQNHDGRGYPVTRIETISDGVINPARIRFVEIEDDEIEKWKMEPGDILFSHINSESHIGKTAIYKSNPKILIHGMNLLLMRPNQKIVLPEYLFALLNMESVRTAYRYRCKRAVNQASLNQKDISALSVATASVESQTRFCRMANFLLDQIEKQKEAAGQIDSLFDNLMHQAFTGDLTVKWREAHMKELLAEMGAQAKFFAMTKNGV